MFISMHQEGYFPPGSGTVEQVGEGAGRGYTVNIPLPCGTGSDGYLHAFERVIAPIGRQFRPQLVLVSAGQDANPFDPLGRMGVTSEGYRQMTRMVKAIAEEACNGRLVALHEGGYSPVYVPFCTVAIIEELAGMPPKVTDPFLPFTGPEFTRLTPWQEDAVGRVVQQHQQFWQLA